MMNRTKLISRATLPDNELYKVLYNKGRDIVVLQVGDTSLTLNASSFMMMNEVVRKAAARLVMQTEIN